MSDILNELKEKIIEEKHRTINDQGNDDDSSGSSGSDSEQSEDNLEAEELMKILPQRVTKKKIG